MTPEIIASERQLNNLISEFYMQKFMETIRTEPAFFNVSAFMRSPDTRPAWRRLCSRIYRWAMWKTVWGFREWLHRDCDR